MGGGSPARIHETAIVEDGVTLGEGTSVWDGVHIRHGARIGRRCIIGEKTYVAYDVQIGDHVKINANVYICAGVTIDEFCMISAHTVFTNDLYPRAGNIELTDLETSDPTGETLATHVRRGVTIGANATIGPGVELGEFAMIGMGSVVTRSVAGHSLVLGNPARHAGWVCICGPVLSRGDRLAPDAPPQTLSCQRCGRRYALDGRGLTLRGDRNPGDREPKGAA